MKVFFKKLTFLLLAVLFSVPLFCQGFYDNDWVFLNNKNLSRLQISSVTAINDFADSTIHPLNNFVFEYKFDTNGNIINRKSWEYDFNKKNKDDLDIKLCIWTGTLDTNKRSKYYHRYYYQMSGQSDVVKFVQNEQRNEAYMKKFYSKLKIKQAPCERQFLDYSEIFEPLLDTAILGKHVYIIRDFLPKGDSILNGKDTITTFRRGPHGMSLSGKWYRTTGDTLRFDWWVDDCVGVWRNYFINGAGFVVKETQNVFTTLYFYSPEGLHIRTESFQDKARTTCTRFNYKAGSP